MAKYREVKFELKKALPFAVANGWDPKKEYSIFCIPTPDSKLPEFVPNQYYGLEATLVVDKTTATVKTILLKSASPMGGELNSVMTLDINGDVKVTPTNTENLLLFEVPTTASDGRVQPCWLIGDKRDEANLPISENLRFECFLKNVPYCLSNDGVGNVFKTEDQILDDDGNWTGKLKWYTVLSFKYPV